MNITPQVSWLTESFTNWCAHLCGLGGDHKLLSMSLTFTLFWCCFSIHIVTHCGCERGGQWAVKYGEDFLQKSKKGLLICCTFCFLFSVGQPGIFTRWIMSNLMDAIQTLPLWRWKEINLTRIFWDRNGHIIILMGEMWSWSWFLVIDRQAGYAEFGAALRATGRPIVYQCEWPLYQVRQQVSKIPEQ